MSKVEEVLNSLKTLQVENNNNGVTAQELSNYINLDRANTSRYLNILYKENKLDKIQGRPVLYKAKEMEIYIEESDSKKNTHKEYKNLDRLIGAEQSLSIPIQQAKAAMIYPPSGLNTLILGETGVGKSLFAESMYFFAKECNILDDDSPFIRFNCADYADNPQLVVAQIFGVKKGAFTGADKDKDGLLKKANNGIIFLDEIHRLSPQGQEMLFTFIDKGTFRMLGDTEKQIKAKVQIIAATTEDPNSYLLKTFTRRIPMIIKLPSLKDRTLNERYYLLKEFVEVESLRLEKSIYFDKNSIISFLLYDCPNNIGQLKSDIQLSCAKAFLNYKAGKSEIIVINQKDLIYRIQQGIMKLKEYRKQIDLIFSDMGDIINFSYKDSDLKEINLDDDFDKEKYFYSSIEKNIERLKKQGVNNEQLSDILNIDIQKHFKKYINQVDNKFMKDELTKIVDIETLNIAETMLEIASKRLDRKFDEKVYVGLSLHLQGSIERIISGNKIVNPKINFVRVEHEKEFILSMELVKILEKKFNIQVPLDEIAYIAMFFTSSFNEINESDLDKVKIILIMHGNSTATSMAEVANNLIGENYIEALDMPLTMKVEDMLEKVKERCLLLNNSKGILLLVDMGSLTNFAEMISKDTGINIKSVDMITTLTAIEAGRKALGGRDLESIYNSCIQIKKYTANNVIKSYKKDFIIITACFTGEGTAEKIKGFIKDNIKNYNNISLKSLNILDKKEFLLEINKLKKDYKIISIVASMDLKVEDIPFISVSSIFSKEGIEYLNNLIDIEQNYVKIKDALKSQVSNFDSDKLINDIRNFMSNLEGGLNIKLDEEIKIGILVHTFFLIDKTLQGQATRNFKGINNFRDKYRKEFIIIKNSLKALESDFNININDDEVAYILKIIVSNNLQKFTV